LEPTPVSSPDGTASPSLPETDSPATISPAGDDLSPPTCPPFTDSKGMGSNGKLNAEKVGRKSMGAKSNGPKGRSSKDLVRRLGTGQSACPEPMKKAKSDEKDTDIDATDDDKGKKSSLGHQPNEHENVATSNSPKRNNSAMSGKGRPKAGSGSNQTSGEESDDENESDGRVHKRRKSNDEGATEDMGEDVRRFRQ
jgi:hypothetical protein